MPKTEKVYPEYIRLDGNTQPRVRINRDVCRNYGERMKAGDQFAPIDVYFDGENYWLADGFHRIQAHCMARPGEPIECNVYQGTLQDAQWHSYGVNKTHGLPRSNPDKKRAAQQALRHPEGATKSDSEIAEHVGISHSTVAKYRKELELSCQIGKMRTRTVTRGKSTYQQNTTNIGKGRKRAGTWRGLTTACGCSSGRLASCGSNTTPGGASRWARSSTVCLANTGG